jgi:D-3-phosphoglycerate dehydrogenase
MLTILAAGDQFVSPQLMTDALRAELAPQEFSTTLLELPWPSVPFGPVGDVDEASGTEEDVIRAVGDASVAVTQMAPFTRKVFASAPDLELVAVCRGGPVNVDLEAASEAGVVVTYAPGRNAQAAAEYALGMILSAMRRIPQATAELRDGRWRGDYYAYPNAGVELADATVGLVGYGAIGRIVARALRVLGANVVVTDPYITAEQVEDHDIAVTDFETLMRRSAVVSLHARLTSDNRHMINAETLAWLPRGAILVNTARGGLVDSTAVLRALDEGRLEAAALDVYDVEPPPADSPLTRHPQVVCTPHLAGASRQTAHRAARLIAAEVGRLVRGEALAHVANP